MKQSNAKITTGKNRSVLTESTSRFGRQQLLALVLFASVGVLLLTSIFAGGPAISSQYPSPYNYKAFCNGFSPTSNLPNAHMRQLHADWWEMYNTPRKKDGITYTRHASAFSDPMEQRIALPLQRPDSNGSYSIARQFGSDLGDIADLLRTTGDPDALDELAYWSRQLRKHVGDWDGRGYEYIRYGNPSNVNQDGHNNDTIWLDEVMMAGNLALLANSLHENRDCSNEYAQEADYWFTYLDENFIPKSLYRATAAERFKSNGARVYTPPAELGLENAYGWTSKDQSDGEDNYSSFSPWATNISDANPAFEYPTRQFAHPMLMNLTLYKFVGDYFEDMNKTPKGTWGAAEGNGSADEYKQAAKTLHDFWYRKTIKNSDGSRDWFLRMSGASSANNEPGTAKAGLRSDTYSQYINYHLNVLHWQQYENFAKDSEMASYADVWYNPKAPNDDVYDKDDYRTMTKYSNATGTTYFQVRNTAYLACWDETGYLTEATKKVIKSTDSHLIGINDVKVSDKWTSGAHYTGQLSCELNRLLDAGKLAGDGNNEPAPVPIEPVEPPADDIDANAEPILTEPEINEDDEDENPPPDTNNDNSNENSSSDKQPGDTGFGNEATGGNDAPSNNETQQGNTSDSSTLNTASISYSFAASPVTRALQSPDTISLSTDNDAITTATLSDDSGTIADISLTGNSFAWNPESYPNGNYQFTVRFTTAKGEFTSQEKIVIKSRKSDVSNDGRTNITDMSMLMANWGTENTATYDLNDDGIVDSADVQLLLSGWD